MAALTADSVKWDGASLSDKTVFSWDVVNSTWVDLINTWTKSANAGYDLAAGLRNQTTPVINDAVGLGSFFVPYAGDYTVYAIVATTGAFGKMHFMLNGVDSGNVDLYSAGTVYNAILTGTLAALTKGEKTISIKAVSKNASSSGYALALEALKVVRA